MSGERERLAEALADLVGEGTPDFWPDTASWADRLLAADGVVGRMLREAQAAALRAAAQEQRTEAEQVPWDDEGTHADGHRCAASFLDRRAAALRDQP